MKKKAFKAESKRLLDLMINSIYTHKEIFLRELISNASDATDKLYYNALKSGNTGLSRESLCIDIAIDKEKRTLSIKDNGCGMNTDELEKNLGTIAKSGSLAFKKENEKKEDIDIIGQFGVGFYSSFMVSKTVKVFSKAVDSQEAFCWESNGADGYTITPCEKDTNGTEVILYLKDNTEDENYDEYLDEHKIKSITKKYSDYIRYPIKMEIEKQKPVEGKEGEFETYKEIETLNSMVPIWRKKSSELTDEDYNNFYKDKFFDYESPLKVIHSSIEGTATYNMMLFIPSKAPYNYYSKEFEKGLQLYSNGVLIMDKCADLLPDHFSFVKGLVDSQDLSLNISREMLQHDRQLKIISTNLEKKIKSELLKMLSNEREKYEQFYKSFGLQLKYGVYNDFGMHKDILQDLIMFHSSSENKLVTLAEYISRMKEEQKFVYYVSGESIAKIEHLPQIELLKDKGYEVLYMTDDIDEFAIKILRNYKEKDFKSISEGDLGLETEEEKKEMAQKSEDNKELFDIMKEALNGKVKEVRLSTRLKSHPVCLSVDGQISLEMEKVLNQMPNDQSIKAEKVLEINANHEIFNKLCGLLANDKDKIKTYAEILYTQALLIEGLSVEDPVAYSNAVCNLML
ncbi:molecular chaperone HtpG [Sedimentibacter sp. zth1]|uniref:molecular chaperone HtpG n=1 Tax=Sedimentibacter sp. zth1 TaxID=2816908 RepID=UPI001A92900E|nr:molecular chaperone HtpG [Sedimentibacter sp. zth1]QSX07130.1 molecular chaperone HtpG [Sedimentibacter sp. zth1]